MSARRRLWLQLSISIPIAAGALALALHGVGAGELVEVWASARVVPLIGAVGAAALLIGVRALRWGILLRAIQPVSAVEIARVGALGSMAIDLFPARLGELVRPLLIARRARFPLGAAMATIVVERLLDLLALLVSLLVALPLAQLPPLDLRIGDRVIDLASDGRNALVGLIALLGAPVILALVLGDTGVRLLEWPARLLPRALATPLLGAARSFIDGVRQIGRLAPLAWAALVTALVWLCMIVVCLALLHALRLDGLGFAEATVVVIVVALCLLLPSPAGGLGSFELGGVAGLSLFGVAQARAAAFAIAMHATHVGAAVLLGVLALTQGGIRLRDLWRTSEEGLGPAPEGSGSVQPGLDPPADRHPGR